MMYKPIVGMQKEQGNALKYFTPKMNDTDFHHENKVR